MSETKVNEHGRNRQEQRDDRGQEILLSAFFEWSRNVDRPHIQTHVSIHLPEKTVNAHSDPTQHHKYTGYEHQKGRSSFDRLTGLYRCTVFSFAVLTTARTTLSRIYTSLQDRVPSPHSNEQKNISAFPSTTLRQPSPSSHPHLFRTCISLLDQNQDKTPI